MKLKDYLIAVDLDGTLITGFDHYDTTSFETLKALAQDNTIIIATGRPLRSSKYYYDLLGLNTPIINYNGALLHHPNDPTFPKQTLHVKRDDLCRFVKDNEDIISNVFCEIEDDIYLQRNSDHILPYLHADGGNLMIGHLHDILPGDPNGAIIFSELGTEMRIKSYVEKTYQGQIEIRFWHADDVVITEFFNPQTNKGKALEAVRQFYHIPKERTIAIGDGHNDIEMLSFAHIRVAMENAHPDLLDVAQFITKSVIESGVHHFLTHIEDFLDNKKAKH